MNNKENKWLITRDSKHQCRLFLQFILLNFLGMMTKIISRKSSEISNVYRLPINKELYVLRGGNIKKSSHSWEIISQRYAFDFVIVKNDALHSNDFNMLENHYIFNEPVYSPAEGEVVSVLNHMPDIKPSLKGIDYNSIDIRGNHVLVKVKSEYYLLAHLKQYSISVKRGDKVLVGTYLGRCGNSGLTSFPHIHFHVQNIPYFYISKGHKIHFSNISVNEIKYEVYELERGMFVKNF